jgi:hypothetical protein
LRSLRHLSILLYARKRKTQFCSLLWSSKTIPLSSKE